MSLLVGCSCGRLEKASFYVGASGFYVSKTYLKEFLMYYDDLLAYRVGLEHDEFDKITNDFKVVIHMDSNLDADIGFWKSQDRCI